MRFKKFFGRKRILIGAIFVVVLILAGIFIWQNLKSKQIEAETQAGADEGILWIEVPPDVSREDVIRLAIRGEVGVRSLEDQAVLDKIEQAIEGRLSELPFPPPQPQPEVGVRELESGGISFEQTLELPFTDLVIGLTKNNKPILPDLEKRASANTNLPEPPSVSTRGSMIESWPCSGLTLNFSPIANPSAFETLPLDKIRSLMNQVSSLCADLEAFQGPPLFPGPYEILLLPQVGWHSTDMTLNRIDISLHSFLEPEFNDDGFVVVLIHEISHAFRDDLVMEPRSFEEGLARAAEYVATSKRGKSPQLWLNSLNNDDYLNQEAFSGPLRYDAFSDTGFKYDSSGSSFLRLYHIDQNVIKKIHQEIGGRKRITDWAQFSDLLLDNFKSLTVEGLSFPDWFKSRKVWQKNANAGRYTAYDLVFDLPEDGRSSPVSGHAKIETLERKTELSQNTYLPEIDIVEGWIPHQPCDFLKYLQKNPEKFPQVKMEVQSIERVRPLSLTLQLEVENKPLLDILPAVLCNVEIKREIEGQINEETLLLIERMPSSEEQNKTLILGTVEVRYPDLGVEPAQSGRVQVFDKENRLVGEIPEVKSGNFMGEVANLPVGPVKLKYISPEGWEGEKLTTYVVDNGSLIVMMKVNAPERGGLRSVKFELQRGRNQVTFPGTLHPSAQQEIVQLYSGWGPGRGYIVGFDPQRQSYYRVLNYSQIWPGRGYSLYLPISSETTISLPVILNLALRELPLLRGWNLVGFPRLENFRAEQIKVVDPGGQKHSLKDATNGGLIRAYFWNAKKSRYFNLISGALPFHQAFWIKANSPGLKLILE